MRAVIFCLAFVPFVWSSSNAQPASASAPNAGCAEILEKWADDPKAVPKRVVDRCKEKLATSEEQPRVFPAPAAGGPAPMDPCTGPDAASSVLCWGPWSALAPAAAGPAVAAALPGPVEGYDPRPELAGPYEPEVIPEPEPLPPLPLGSCPPGAPCGFATVMDGVVNDTESESQEAIFARADLASDGTQFTIDPPGDTEINSVSGMTTDFTATRPDDYEEMVADGRVGDEQSALRTRVIRNDQGDIQAAADWWAHGNRATRTGNNGHFAWGTATSQAGLDNLNGQGVTVSFTGPMSVDNRTTGTMALNFGTQANWTGNWVNPGYNFSAAGPMSGADLISDNTKFSANVQAADSVVQGALIGEPGTQSLIHIIDVNLTEKGRVRDVGLLRQAAAP